jgi:hypothetical protein
VFDKSLMENADGMEAGMAGIVSVQREVTDAQEPGGSGSSETRIGGGGVSRCHDDSSTSKWQCSAFVSLDMHGQTSAFSIQSLTGQAKSETRVCGAEMPFPVE